MDAIALDSSETALTLLAESLPQWALKWEPQIGAWTVIDPKGTVRASDRSPLEAVLMASKRIRLFPSTNLVL